VYDEFCAYVYVEFLIVKKKGGKKMPPEKFYFIINYLA